MYNTPTPRVKDSNGLFIHTESMEGIGGMGARIRQLREQKGWTQEELAQKIGSNRASVSQWEHGHTENMRTQSLAMMIQVFGVDFEYLIWGPTRAPPESLIRRQNHRKG